MAQAPAASPGQATLDELSGVAADAEQRALSDNLGVSSALMLGAHDMLRLRAMLEEPTDTAHAQLVLRRLSMVPMTIKLDETTGFVAFMAGLSSDETVQAAVEAGAEAAVQMVRLIARIRSTWEAQLGEEQKQLEATRQRLMRRDANAEVVPKKKSPKDPNCLACQGRHRPHTCK